MPIYEYTCGACEAKFDQLVRTMSGDAKVKCPECGSPKTARALSVFAVSSDGGKSAGGSAAADAGPGMCGRCGELPGSCGM